MAGGNFGSVTRQITRLFGEGTTAGMTETELLDRFTSRRDAAAFESLVARHGPMVLGVCRRMLGQGHDVEDAFQATFLVLVKKARSHRGIPSFWVRGFMGWRIAWRFVRGQMPLEGLRRSGRERRRR